jgi:hypothetical protein
MSSKGNHMLLAQYCTHQFLSRRKKEKMVHIYIKKLVNNPAMLQDFKISFYINLYIDELFGK